MGRSRRAAERRAGFTLIEILAVILIIGILAGILLTQLGGAGDSVSVGNTKLRMTRLRAAIEEHERETGDYPPSSFTAEQGVPNEGENVGAEALVVALFSNGRDPDLGDDVLVNTDGDAAPTKLTDFETRDLLEVADDWGNPIAYLHHRDYETKGRVYLTIDAEGLETRSEPRVYKDPATGRFKNHRSFQLVSAGKNGVFDDDDDVTLFEERE